MTTNNVTPDNTHGANNNQNGGDHPPQPVPPPAQTLYDDPNQVPPQDPQQGMQQSRNTKVKKIVIGVVIALVVIILILAIGTAVVVKKITEDAVDASNKAIDYVAEQTTPTPQASDTPTPPPQQPQPEDKDIPLEYREAVDEAQNLSRGLHLSRQTTYDMLVGPKQISAEAAEYAVDHAGIDYQYNAYKTAEYYVDQGKTKEEIKEELQQPWEKFTQEEAQYAIDHLP